MRLCKALKGYIRLYRTLQRAISGYMGPLKGLKLTLKLAQSLSFVLFKRLASKKNSRSSDLRVLVVVNNSARLVGKILQ